METPSRTTHHFHFAVNPRAGCSVASVGIGAVDGPDDGYISNAGRLRDLRAIHEPHRYIAAGVLPENVALAVAVEVAGLDDRPHGRGITDGSRLRDLLVIHQPPCHLAAGVAPYNVALP